MRTLATALLAALSAIGAARAESHAVVIRNGAAETIRAVQVGPAGRLGENRMRSQLPPGAEARITYSTGCQADVRLTFASGQTEDHAGLDLCSDPRIVAGAGAQIQAGSGTASASLPIAAQAVKPTTGKTPDIKPAITKPSAPNWTGHSLIRRFGGMD